MTKNTLICLSLSLLLLTSCGSKRTLLPNNQSSDISQQQDNGQNFSSDLVIETTGTDFTKVVSKAGKASEDIKLRPSHGTLFNFSVSLDTKSQENNDWTLHRNGNCTGDLTQFDYCVVTVDYHPNQQGAAYAYLDIKYSTDGHNDTNNQFVLINTINTPLIGKSSLFHTNSSLWTQSTFTTAAGSWFINQTLMENEDALHLFNTEDDSYLKINNIEPTNIGIAHIGKDRNYFFYTNFSSQKKNDP